jgi:hypothetical protein
MEMPRLGKSVRKVVKLERDDDGTFVPTLVYKGGSQKKKVSSALRPLERGIRRIARSHVVMGDAYLKKHNRSNEKNRDGWIRDLVTNVGNAANKGQKRLTKTSKLLPIPLRMN